jgi:hypothetical protein
MRGLIRGLGTAQSLAIAATASALGLGALAWGQLPAMAAAPAPSLEGIWSGVSHAIYTGQAPPTFKAVDEHGATVDSGPFSVEIQVQDGELFYGMLRSPALPEPEAIVGAIQSDGETAHYATRRAHGTLTLLDANTIEACQVRGDDSSMLAGCGRLRRE